MLLQDDKKRMGYAEGTKDPMQEAINNLMGLGVSKEEVNIIQNNTMSSPEVRKIINRVEKETGAEPGNVFSVFNMIAKKEKEERAGMKEGGPGIKALRQVAPEVVERMGYEDGGSIDDQMLMVMTPPTESEMESDDDMEDGYTRFIMEEALTEDEEDMLMSKLEQDEELAMIFDKVIDVAQEFAGAGPVEGPGSGVSDSIPARLSDGEFVFTAKAVEEIGADNLMAMMKEAEAKADERQPLQEGGIPEFREETRPVETPQMTEQVIRVERGPQTEQVGVGGSLLDSVSEEDNPLYEEMAFKRPPVHGAGYGR
jgi:hypothetical protein